MWIPVSVQFPSFRHGPLAHGEISINIPKITETKILHFEMVKSSTDP